MRGLCGCIEAACEACACTALADRNSAGAAAHIDERRSLDESPLPAPAGDQLRIPCISHAVRMSALLCGLNVSRRCDAGQVITSCASLAMIFSQSTIPCKSTRPPGLADSVITRADVVGNCLNRRQKAGARTGQSIALLHKSPVRQLALLEGLREVLCVGLAHRVLLERLHKIHHWHKAPRLVPHPVVLQGAGATSTTSIARF